MAADLLLAIDQGTTGTTVLVMDTQGRALARHTQEFPQHYPEPGWVEHDADEIWQSVVSAAERVLANPAVDKQRVAAIGITNQRETTLLWERASGKPIARAIVWQDRRTADICKRLRDRGKLELVRGRTGLVLDPYFSGTKLAWLLDNVNGARERAKKGELAFGTIDSFLIHRLSAGESHVTDATNASRTLLMSLETCAWDDEMLDLLAVPPEVLPRIVSSAAIVAKTKGFAGLPDGLPIAGIAGDQQAALFGQACFEVGDTKCTYGTGAFALTNIGKHPKVSRQGLLTTVAWKTADEVIYALEGSAFIAGAAVQWLRDGLGLVQKAADIEALAASVPSSDGVVFVPALAGLGAPHWDADARGAITGITRGTTAAHVARATLEGIAFQVADLLSAMRDDLGQPLKRMRVDGGAAANDLLMQFQSDIAAIAIERPRELESTARGAAMLAGVGVGLFPDIHAAGQMSKAERTFEPAMTGADREARLRRWGHAVRLATSHD